MKYARVLATMIVIAIFCLLAAYVWSSIVSKKVIPPRDVLAEEWVDGFKRWAVIIALVSGISSLVWYILAQWVFKVNSHTQAGRRWVWLLLFLPSVVAVILGICFTRHVQQGAWIAYLFYAVNGLLVYYLATVLFSPPSFRYTPWPVRQLRRRT